MKTRWIFLSILGLALQACSTSSDGTSTGGASGQAGSSGGALETGGTKAAAGMTGAGGTKVAVTGGATESGGVIAASGGAGGASETGGAIDTGGTGDLGGTTVEDTGTTSGGAGSTGTTGGGGTNVAGGTTKSGGNSGSAGATVAGGTKAGGSSGSGGAVAGGTKAGGSSGSGGAPATGGTAATGGTTASTPTGGTVTFAGCSTPAPAGSPVALHGQLKVVGNKLQDQSGNPVQLKGVSAFWLNWENPKYAESKAAMQYMRDNWKMMALRAPLGTSASGGYTTSAANKTALQARMDTITQNAIALGVYVILDWHSGSAQNEQATSIEFFTGMAQKYGACPNVIYEDYNEPVNVTWAQIKPYHTAVVAAIRAVDPDNLIIMGTPNWSQDVDKAAADPVTGTNLLYTLHFYSCSHSASLRAKGDTAMSKGVALFITEFGATPADGGVSPNNKVCEAEANLWFTWMTTNDISGTAWKLAAGKDSSNYFTTAPPVDGPFPDSVLNQTNGTSPGHGQFIVNWMRQ